MQKLRSRLTRALGGVTAGLLILAPSVAAQTGSVAGRVIDAQTGQNIPAAQVFIATLDIGVLSQQNGTYILLNVPAGQHSVTVQRIGYGTTSQNVSVTAGQTSVLDFRVSEEALQLDEVIVTGTPGGTARRALGNSIEVVEASAITEQQTITNMQDLLAGRTPGLRFGRNDGQVGGGSGISIRGVSSVSLGSQPLIYVDGIRVDNDATVGPATGIGGANASALNDINPDDIESIEVIKGPSAATLYGTEASAGVIQIITKRGSVGAPEFEIEVGTGTNYMRDPAGTLGNMYGCAITAAQCPADQIFEVNLYDEANHYMRGTGRFAGLTPGLPGFNHAASFAPPGRDSDLLQNGLMQRYNLSVRGGTDQVRYYLSGSFLDEAGTVDYNTNSQVAGRANVTVLFGEDVNVDFSTGYSQGHTQFATVRREGGVWHQLTWGRPNNLPGVRPDNPLTAADESLGSGYLGFQERFPASYEATNIYRDYQRFTGSMTASHRYGDWLSQRLTFGIDRSSSIDNEFIPGRADFPNAPFGSLEYGRPMREFVTFDYSVSGTYNVTESFGTRTSVGAQYYTRFSESVVNSGTDFPTEVQTVISQTELATRDVSFSSIEEKTLGFYVEEQLSWEDRIFVTGAMRGDDNSAFGANFELQYYPKVSASWVVSEEAFWNVGFMNSFRLRGAWGKSGRQPGTFASQTLYGTRIGPNGNGLIPTTAGNPDIGPEVSTELEVGFDAAFLDDRLSGTFSWYTTKTEDMLVTQSLAPSIGLPANRDANLGELKNWGWEAQLNARVFESPTVAFDLAIGADNTQNEIVSLGENALPNANFQIGWPFPNIATDYIIRDAQMNAAGTTVDLSTVTCDAGLPAVDGGPNILRGGATIACSDYDGPGLLLGPSFPKYSFSVAPTLTLWQDLQVFALAEGQYGRWIANIDAQYACGIYANCLKAVERTDPRWIAGRLFGVYGDDRYQGRFPADFWTMRQIGLRYTLPSNIVSRVGGDRASLSISGNNLFRIWQKVDTDLAGNPIYDPEYAINSNDPAQIALWELPGIASINATLRVTF